MDFTSLIKTIAPWIGTALGGPLGGIAIDMATQALGGSEKTAEGLKNALAGASPEAMLALKKADQDFALQMQGLGFKNTADLEAIAAGDRKSARDMQMTTKSRVPALLTGFLTVGMTTIIGLLIFKGIPDSAVVQLLLGNYVTAWVGSTVYWFGTTNSSQTKTELIARAPAIQT